jgi:hypothetical protein
MAINSNQQLRISNHQQDANVHVLIKTFDIFHFRFVFKYSDDRRPFKVKRQPNKEEN